MTFLPESPLTALYAAALGLVAVFGALREPRLWPVIAVMVGNWILTRLATAYEWPAAFEGMVDLLSAVVLVALSRTRAMAVLPVSALFGLMVGSYVMADFGVLSRETMWAWADVGAYLQLLVIAGIAADGGSGRLARVGHGLRGVPAVARAVAKRVSAPDPS